MGRLALAACVCVACSAKPAPSITPDAPATSPDAGIDPNDGATSGTRLKLTWFQFSDGSRQFDGLYDSERKEFCSPYMGDWPDGNNYCVPTDYDPVVFSDSACTKPLADEYTGSTCATTPLQYALDTEYSACADNWLPQHLYVKGSAVGATTYYEKASDGTCFQYDKSDYEQLYAVTGEIATTDLVRLVLGPATGSGAIEVRSWVSSDGATLPETLHDPNGGYDCSPEYYGAAATTALCAPDDSGWAYLDRDSTCTDPTMSYANGCTPPAYTFDYPETSCPIDLAAYFATGSALASPKLYESFGADCSATDADDTQTYYATGGALALAQLQRTPDNDPSYRLQVIHYDATGGLVYRDQTYLYDSQEGVVCAPEALPDGTTRCVPDSDYQVTSGIYFSDSACKTKLDVVDIFTGPAACGAPMLPVYVRKYLANDGCTESFELHQLAAKLTTLYYLGGTSGSACTKYSSSEDLMYGIGSAVSTSDFLTAVVTIDN